MKNCNEIRMKSDGVAEIMIYDEIGASWFSEGVTAKGFSQQLKELGDIKQIDVRVNSPGGPQGQEDRIHRRSRCLDCDCDYTCVRYGAHGTERNVYDP